MARVFPEQPYLVAVKESGDVWINDADYTYVIDKDGAPLASIIVPKGFQTDGASAPRWAWTMIGFLPRGIHDPAALMHDWLYENKGRVRTPTGWFTSTRKDADRLFLRILKQVGVKSWHATLAYLAVRGFGLAEWKD